MHESMFYTNVAGCLVALVLALLSGHLVGGVKFSIAQPEVLLPIVGTGPEARLLTGSIRPRPDRARGCGAAMILAQAPATGSKPNPEQVLLAILLYSISSAVGQNFVYFTVTEFGPLILTTVTTVRKIFSTLTLTLTLP